MKKIILITAVLFVAGLTVSAQKLGNKVGDKAPDLVGKTPKGDVMKLSDTQGNLVLLDFWASWCPPCRRENPHVVKAYNHYKDKAFSNGKKFIVFNVSLDKTPDRWKQGIEQDKLNWPYHISDLKGWQSKLAATYGVRSIPTNFLIDENGVIIARDLRGPALEAALEKYVK